MCKAFSYRLYNVCESVWTVCDHDRPDSLVEGCGYRKDWSSAQKIRPSTCLHFGGKWIIGMIVVIGDIVRQALPKITCSHAAMVYCFKTSIDLIYGFWTQLPTEIPTMVACLLAKDRFTCPTNVREVRSKFAFCLIIALTIDSGVQVSICSNRNCGSYSLDIFLWHTTNGNERYIIDWWTQPNFHCPHSDHHPLLSVGLENWQVLGPARIWSRRWSTT